MADYDNRNSGALFKNDRKESERQPDFSGPFTGPNGEELSIAAWARQSKSGKKFLSIKVSEPYKKKDQPSGNDFLEDDDTDGF